MKMTFMLDGIGALWYTIYRKRGTPYDTITSKILQRGYET